MDPAKSGSKLYEGVETGRHLGTGIVQFTDGHVEARKSDYINPPVDPRSGFFRGLINSCYWGPLQRAGQR